MEETRQCAECNQTFSVDAEDFSFYKKINVLPPTRCPDCRQRRRYAWRNERTLYRRDCDLCGKNIVTIYHPKSPYTVYCVPCWWGDEWDWGTYARDFDFKRPFFEQFHELQLEAPRIALLTKRSVNSDYTNHSGDNKNCYLSFGVFNGENIMYSTNLYLAQSFKDCVDNYHVTKGGELLYECVDSEQCYGCQYGMLLRGCNDCYYCYDLRGCSNCFLCWNLRGKQYCILNKEYSKEEYFERFKEFALGSHEAREKLYGEWTGFMEEKALHRFAVIERSVNVSGSMITGSKNSQHLFDGDDIEDSKYATLAVGAKNAMDCYHFGLGSDLMYDCHATGVGVYNAQFAHLCYDNSHIAYCDTCHNCENLFGCVSVKKGKYCILNKKYSEDEYKELRGKIVAHMKETGEYGEFFPPSLAPVSYNETQGMVYMPLTEEEVKARGWKWEKELPGTFGKETVAAGDIPDRIQDVDDSLTKEVLACAECSRNYNIVEPELAFYVRQEIPVPRLCPDCRYGRKIALRPPRKLWYRQCMCDYEVRDNTVAHEHHPKGRCPNKFETPYNPERGEIIYCEECYNKEVT